MGRDSQRESIWEITGKVQGEVTLGHVDIFLRYLKKIVARENEADTADCLKKLRKVDPRVWSQALRSPEFATLWQGMALMAAMGVLEVSKEQREWFKMVGQMAGIFGGGDRAAGKYHANKIVINNVVGSDVPQGDPGWIDPRDGTLGSLKPHKPVIEVDGTSEAEA